MRSLSRFALAGLVVAGFAAEAPAQGVPRPNPYYAYGGYGYAAPAPGAVYSRGYAFKDESPFSINRSYLGYGNLTYTGPGNPGPSYMTGPAASRANGTYPYASAQPRRGLFGLRWRRGYGN
jgi:hypothetical protein